MINRETSLEYYDALLRRDSRYEGIFFVGVRTTGVFCRPSCPARKPRFENCEFFRECQTALLAGYRPCKRCQPLLNPSPSSPLIVKLLKELEQNPKKVWRTKDLSALRLDPSTVRRQFKKHFGMTFFEYARSIRIGNVMQQLRSGKEVIEAQLAAGYESSSGFRSAFSRHFGMPPSASDQLSSLYAERLNTPLGPMVAIADETQLYLLEFLDRRALEKEIQRLCYRKKTGLIPGLTAPLASIKEELTAYFAGDILDFSTPHALLGSPFQQRVWEELRRIPAGETRSYKMVAEAIGQPTASRAAARANGANQLALVIPCHRVINANGELGGYGGGLARKRWLLDHERGGIS